jgi:hypothetical protein
MGILTYKCGSEWNKTDEQKKNNIEIGCLCIVSNYHFINGIMIGPENKDV